MLAIDDLLVARDFSSVSDRAVGYALDLAARTGATLHVLHAEVLHESSDPVGGARSPGDDLARFRNELKQEGSLPAEALDAIAVEEVVRRDVSAGPAIVNYAADVGIDLITLGTHGRRGPSRILLGSVAEEVLDAEADEITDAAEKRKAAFVITATHGRTGLECMLMGSVAERVLRQAPCPVCVVKSFGRSLVEDDESPNA